MSPSRVRAAGAAIEVRGVSYRFDHGGGRQVLRDLSFETSPGEFVVITGPSGAGKTTLLSLVGGLRAVQSGGIRILDRELAALGEPARQDVRRGIGFIFQDHHLFDALTAADTLRLAMGLFKRRYGRSDYRSIPRELLTRLGLESCMNSKPGQMSTGQKQRVAVARALVNAPRIILADEPTAALDGESADRVLDLLVGEVRERDGALLMITHDQRLFGRADRVLHLVDGRLA